MDSTNTDASVNGLLEKSKELLKMAQGSMYDRKKMLRWMPQFVQHFQALVDVEERTKTYGLKKLDNEEVQDSLGGCGSSSVHSGGSLPRL